MSFPHGENDPHLSVQDTLLNVPLKSAVHAETSYIPDPRLSQQSYGHVRYPSDDVTHAYEHSDSVHGGRNYDRSLSQPTLDRSYLEGSDQFPVQRRPLL